LSANPSDTAYPQISVIVPVLNEEESIEELSHQIISALSEAYTFEIIFVDDGSDDGSWQIVETLSKKENNIKAIRFLRNYGKSTALQAGFKEADGRCIATIDADLQDDPAEIPEMIEMLGDGYDLVSGWKKERHDPLSKTLPSLFFNKVTARLTGIDLNDFNCGLKVYKREVIEHIQLYGERHRYIPLLAKWQGYDRIGEKAVNHRPRKYGTTKFGFSRFMHGFLDLITLIFVSKYQQRPMHFFGSIGFIFLLVGGLVNSYLAIDKIFFGANLGDRPLLLLAVMLMVLGAQFFSIGFLGELFYKHRSHSSNPNIQDKI
jgi:glycosyltransferase involved in cell wall biosynthesis